MPGELTDAAPPTLSPTSSYNGSIDDELVDVGDGVEMAPVHDDVRDDIICDIFNLPKSTIFYQDFSCALVSTIVYHGRMYPAGDQVCFYSNLFGKETKLLIPYDTIADVSKTSSMFSHGLRIQTTLQKEYAFSSFWGNNRDHCAAIIVALRQKCLGVSPTPVMSASVAPQSAPPPKPIQAAAPAPSPSPQLAPTPPPSEPVVQASPSVSTVAATPLPPPLSLTPDEQQHPFADVAHDTLSVSSDEFVKLFISDDAIYGIGEANRRRGATDIACTPWVPDQHGRVYSRTVTFTQPVDAPIGPQSSRVDVKQCRYSVNESTIHIDTTTKLADIPYGDCFHVDDRFVLTSLTPSSCDLVIQLRVVFVKSTMWRGLIESRAKSECKQKSLDWIQLAKAAISPDGLPPWPPGAASSSANGGVRPLSPRTKRPKSTVKSPVAHDAAARKPSVATTGVTALEPLRPTRQRLGGGRRLASIVIPWAVIVLLGVYIRHVHTELVAMHATLRAVQTQLDALAAASMPTAFPQCPVALPEE